MIINFVGLFSQPSVTGEISDETHLAREMENLGHEVRKMPRDEWREQVLSEKPYPHIPIDPRADINIVCKWHHFFDGRFVEKLREASGAPVFYWVWDYMYDQGFPDWHLKMAQAADLYLSNEGGVSYEYARAGVRYYYFPFDVADAQIEKTLCPGLRLDSNLQKPKDDWIHDLVFTGTFLGQGDRKEWLQQINKEVPVKVYSWNYEEWTKLGFDASPAIYGKEYNRVCALSKINLGFSVNPDCWGYWSNRVGKVLLAGGFLLYQYAPGMELALDGAVAFFSSPAEAIEKIKYYLSHEVEREAIRRTGETWASRYSSATRVKQLMILCERYLKGNPEKWNRLP